MNFKDTIRTAIDTLAQMPVIGEFFQPKPKIAVLRLSGIIADGKRTALSHHTYERLIEKAFDTHNLKAVALAINSPGGSPAQSALIASHIRRLADEKEVPVFAFVEDVAASGGYWLACAADEIYAAETSIVGSIGVISASFGFQELIARYGVERRVHTSGKDKGFLDPFLEEKPEDVKRLKEIQKELHESFKDWVSTRRAEKLEGSDKELFEGAFWTAPKALKLGLIDGLADLRGFAKEKYGEDIKLVELSPEKGFISGLISGDAVLNKASIPAEIADIIEQRSLWARYGL